MAQRTFTHKPIVPKGYTGKNFNQWQRYLHGEISLVYMDKKQIKSVEDLIQDK